MLMRARAPVRIDFAGGWTDVSLFCQETKGYVLNASINIYSYVTAKKLAKKQVETKEYGYKHYKTLENRTIKIYSADFDVYQEAEDIKQLEYNGNIDLAKAAIKKMEIDNGIEIVTRSNAPAGSGLGTSASMGVALIGALSHFAGKTFLSYEFAEMASAIERYELGILGGKQDQYASAYGGINFMEFKEEDVKVSKLRLPHDTICELEKNLVLCYTGKSRLSGDIHEKVTEAFVNAQPDSEPPCTGAGGTVDAIKNLKQIAVDMKDALMIGDLNSFAQLLEENWRNQKRLHYSVTNPQIEELFEIAKENGALGGKACGAGGGGCLVFYCPDQEHVVRKKLQAAGAEIIDFNFEFAGLQTWTVE